MSGKMMAMRVMRSQNFGVMRSQNFGAPSNRISKIPSRDWSRKGLMFPIIGVIIGTVRLYSTACDLSLHTKCEMLAEAGTQRENSR